jgi:Na+-transporting NADH:ubiquinone oxidoreductase subunit A
MATGTPIGLVAKSNLEGIIQQTDQPNGGGVFDASRDPFTGSAPSVRGFFLPHDGTSRGEKWGFPLFFSYLDPQFVARYDLLRLGMLSGFLFARLCDNFHKVKFSVRKYRSSPSFSGESAGCCMATPVESMKNAIRIRRGLQVPVSGLPQQQVSSLSSPQHVGFVGDDYVGMKPTMHVKMGDRVRKGQSLFEDKNNPGAWFTSPATGTVTAIERGKKRKFESLAIEVDWAAEEQQTFDVFEEAKLSTLDAARVCRQLTRSGLWTAFRRRPFSHVPKIDSRPDSIFVTAIDTNPLAADPAVILQLRPADFVAGLEVLSTLTDGPLRVCHAVGVTLPGEDGTLADFQAFSGPHPAGLVGTHIHFLAPVSATASVWHIGYQDVIAIGHLFRTGEILTDRVVALGGPPLANPRLVRTHIGASLTELVAAEERMDGQALRIISGSVLSGRRAEAPVDFLGRYHNQISCLAEGGAREFLGWLKPGEDKFSLRRIFASRWHPLRDRCFAMNTSTHGSPRAVVPIGMYEDVMPLDIVATPLLKALLTDDTESAQKLGVLELDEEDLALCTFVCPGKHEYGDLLRRSLNRIEAEG